MKEFTLTKLELPKDASKEDIAKKLAEVILGSLDEAEDDGKEAEIDICKGCKDFKTCSDEHKSKHREMFRTFRNFKNALENILEAMDERADQDDFVEALDELSEKSKALADILRPKE